MTDESYIDKFPHEKEAIDTILAIKDEFANRIPEDIFVSRYLPMFINKDKQEVNLQEWINLAGHVYAEVIVEDKFGNELFRVPPIFKRFKTKEHQHAYQSVDEIIKTSKLHAINSPIMGEKVLEAGLTNTLPNEEIKNSEDENWKNILKRYGVVVNTDGSIKEKVIAKTIDPDEIDSYDVA